MICLSLALGARGAEPIHFHTDQAGIVSIGLYRSDGSLAAQIMPPTQFAAGDHRFDPGPAISGSAAPAPGDYTWRVSFHKPFALEPFGTLGDFGGDRGPPSAAAADASRVFLGWSLASGSGDTVVAVTPAGKIIWTHHRGAFSGCSALSVDAGTLYVLGGEGGDAEGRAIYKLDAATGASIPWPNGQTDLEVRSLWPKGGYKADRAQAFAVKNGRIYLSFTGGQFIAMLDAKNGGYLQTLVGAPPGAIDAVATQSDLPGKPGSNVEADFMVTAFNGSVVGTTLMAHDPIWVIGSDATPVDPDNVITALSMIGDGAPHHAHDIFLGMSPSNQIEARPVLEIPTIKYVAGTAGGRLPAGPWDGARLGQIRGLALDATGQLWCAEGDSAPKRISVWSTDTQSGRLLHEYFAPPFPGSPVAMDPADPTILYADGCEWQIDAQSHRALCRNVIYRNPVKAARFALQGGQTFLVVSPRTGSDLVFERNADGSYKPSPQITLPSPNPLKYLLTPGSFHLISGGLDLGPTASPSPLPSDCELSEEADGSLYLIARYKTVQIFKVANIDTLKPIATGNAHLP